MYLFLCFQQTQVNVLQNYWTGMIRLAIFILIISLATLVITSGTCQCLNKGICSSFNRCQCLPGFIGQKCQIRSHSLTQQGIDTTLNANYTYFYFQPTQTNYYRLTFNICMLYNPYLLPILFYIQTQKTDGALGSIHSLFETAKIVTGENGCMSFSTHYISIKRKDDEIYRRIVVGMKVLQKDDPSHYLNVYRSDQSLKDEIQTKQQPIILLPASFNYQRVTVHMKYQKYIQTNYLGNFIIVSTACILLIIFSLIINYISKRYRVQIQDRVSQFHQFDISRYRYHSRHNPEMMEDRKIKNKEECIEVFMPATRYGEKSCFFVAEQLTNFEEVIENDNEDCCSICLSEFTNYDQIRTTPCKHQYHKECIDNWCEYSLSCPICRHPLDFRREIKKIYVRLMRRRIVR